MLGQQRSEQEGRGCYEKIVSKGAHLRLASTRLSACFAELADAACTSWLSFRRFSSLLKASGSSGIDMFSPPLTGQPHTWLHGLQEPACLPSNLSKHIKTLREFAEFSAIISVITPCTNARQFHPRSAMFQQVYAACSFQPSTHTAPGQPLNHPVHPKALAHPALCTCFWHIMLAVHCALSCRTANVSDPAETDSARHTKPK